MQENQQKVLISILMDNLQCGGAERVAVNLANGIVQRGYKVDMVLSSATGEFLVDLLPEVRIVDLNATQLRWALIPLVLYLLRARPDAILACMWPLSVIGLIACQLVRFKARIVVAEHTTFSRVDSTGLTGGHWMAATTMRMAYRKACNVVAVSQGVADDLASFARIDRSSITVIYNPVVHDSKEIHDLPMIPNGWCSGQHYRVLAVGSLKPIKDYSTLLDAFALLRKQIDAKLLILGEGEYRLLLEQQIRCLGIEDVVFMPGFIRNPEPYFQHAHLHVLSSTGEGLPTVIIEALASGTPIVSTDCQSGPREILEDGKYGYLVPVGDVNALALAMAKALTDVHDKEELMKRAEDFSVNNAVDSYLKLLLDSKGRGFEEAL